MVRVLISADSKFPIHRPKIRQAVEAVVRQKGVSSDVEVSVLVCGARKSATLTKKYLQEAQVHDVLSFSLADEDAPRAFPSGQRVADFVESQGGVLILGDIVICYPLAQEEANRDNVLVDTKIDELVTHGMLHLLGEHHD